ncbi:MAG: LacI family DNA-binding transcriptional regulator [Erythrobacter sp.]|uniref:LacI family DNA-binding transcriptional regulator n=1 Tax=Erythrobacter sp. TaxID=1042 RepID=UPI002B49339F|nr:LacI family DNA-binding transcriptional regulator [Erythrobacter sp.]WRH69711.1 MAG: LacI family DNA-binding transcriptional regulator [Erythrobacter sp.]
MGRGITIEDVASAAAVSRQTVSRVINRSPRVSPEAKARVEAAIAALGWVPSAAARSMAGGRSRILLAVFAAPAEGLPAAQPLGQLLLAGTTACNAHGYRLIFEQLPAETEAAAGVAQLAAAIGALEPEGVILLPPLDRRRDLAALVESRNLRRETLSGTGASVVAGNPGEAAARHLMALGHRQIGFIAGAGDPAVSQANLAGYRRVMADNGSRAHHHFTADVAADLGATLELARAWLVPTIRPTAIITERAANALAVLHVAASLRIAVPQALSLVSLEDDPALAACQPPLAALHMPAGTLFAAACTRLIAKAETPGEAALPPPPSLELIERASLARAPRGI